MLSCLTGQTERQNTRTKCELVTPPSMFFIRKEGLWVCSIVEVLGEPSWSSRHACFLLSQSEYLSLQFMADFAGL